MGLLGLFRRQRDGTPAVSMPSAKKKKLTVRIPEPLLLAVKEKCVRSNITLNEATNLLFTWLNNEFIEFEIVKRVKRRRER